MFEKPQPHRFFAPDEVAELHRVSGGEIAPPFSRSANGLLEYVATEARLVNYFVIATQTCDVSGVDKKSNRARIAVVAPLTPVMDVCFDEVIRLKTADPKLQEERAIHAFLTSFPDFAKLRESRDAVAYGEALVATMNGWKPAEAHNRENKNLIVNRLKGFRISQYWLKGSAQFGVPLGFVDLACFFAISTSRLDDLRTHRVATLTDVYRADFANKIGQLFGRPATPEPMIGDVFGKQ